MVVRMVAKKNRVDEAIVVEDELDWLLRYEEHPKWWMNAAERMRYKMTVMKMYRLLDKLIDSERIK